MQIIQSVSILNSIQKEFMKFVKIIHLMTDILNKELQHWVESEFIEVKKKT
jgi:hypothetical protein